jgi:hypothetical protein
MQGTVKAQAAAGGNVLRFCSNEVIRTVLGSAVMWAETFTKAIYSKSGSMRQIPGGQSCLILYVKYERWKYTMFPTKNM